jgi:hypothetical protein
MKRKKEATIMDRIKQIESRLKKLEDEQKEQNARAVKALKIFEEETKKAGFKMTTPAVEKLKENKER